MKRLLLNTKVSKIYIISVIIITLLLLTSYFSYAMFTVTNEKNNAISIVTGTLDYKLEIDRKEGNTLTIPGETSIEFIVTLSNPNNRIARFNFYYLNEIPDNVTVGYITDCETNPLPEEIGVNLETSKSIGSSNKYKIMVENNSHNEVVIELGVSVGLDYNDLSLPSNGHLFKEYINEPNAPELDTNMIAVKYENNNWVKADISNANNDWYNYNEQKWANAVTVSSSTRESYKNASVGTIINMNDIETMWVWIPRYSYTIGSKDGTNYYGKQGNFLTTTPTQELPGEIDVKFVASGEKDRCSAKYKVGEEITSWYTPDAFTFGDEELSGIWVGKFETSSSDPSLEHGGGNTTELDPMIKPNVVSWRGNSIANIFNISLKMNDEGNRYGFSSNVDTHAMKSSEWGAVTYLTQSKYGKIGNTNYSGANKEVYQNKSDQYITGCSWGAPGGGTGYDFGCQYTYDININGTGASTTGNIYGIYDMVGCSHEFMMGNYNDITINSGFSSMPDAKYYDKYTSDDTVTACNGGLCKSYYLSEIAHWYNDFYATVNSDIPWIICGSNYYYPDGSIEPLTPGIFWYSTDKGTDDTHHDRASRIVIAP
ncbi:MAG TPA: hypothetical protein IAB45_02555 [Candidatus Onthousia faecavium]|nr:hypothetical protein [Candidatus Onthousia faecavium]